MTANIKAMEIHLRNAVNSALAAQQRLSRARRAAGIDDSRSIYTAAEVKAKVKAMRIEWYAEWRGMMKNIYDPDPTLKRLAQLMIGARNSAKKAQSAEDAADQIVAAAATARAGGPERPKPEGLAADIVAAGKKRRIPMGGE